MHLSQPLALGAPQAPACRTRRRVAARCRGAVVATASQGARPAVVILPGLGNEAGDYTALAAELESRNFCTRTAQVARIDWARNAAGITDPAYWAGTLCPTPTVNWYLERITQAVDEAKEAAGTDKVTLVAHSAGGWMSRVWLLERQRMDDVSLLLTLGSPLRRPPSGAGVFDQTRGILKYVDERCPGPVDLAAAGGKFVCLAGRYLKGSEQLSEFQGWVVGQGYKQVCGAADVWGDGITPVEWAHLDGAENVTLEGVYHSPVGASAERPWYGSPGILEQWLSYLGAADGSSTKRLT